MLRKLVIAGIMACLLAAHASAASSAHTIDSLMNQLDKVLSERQKYIDRKEARLAQMRHNADSISDARARFDAVGALMDEYLPFNTDSAFTLSLERERIATALGDSILAMNARMNQANILNATAMYKECADIMKSIRFERLPAYLRPFYFHIKRTVYGRLADYAAFEPERQRYRRLTDMYRDSLLSVNDPDSLTWAIIKADKLNANGRPADAVAILKKYRENHHLAVHDEAICAWTLSESYSLLGDTENQKKELLISSIADMKSAVREYVALRQLAFLLYKEGDLERSYRFLTIAVDDATKCNARQRIIELNAFYPVINNIYVDKIQSQKRMLTWAILIITVLTLVLLALLTYTRKQMKKVAEARKTIQEAYERLNELNAELQKSNRKLHDANRDIAEISELKEVYIGRYMDQCLEYIDKLDLYRKSLGKLYNSGKTADLVKALKSTTAIDNELKAFYDQFDQTFLSLFPTFVEDFNQLLQPQEAIVPKKEGSLTTELRIFALIRLGITDSDSIAKFLRYSLTTIYNYRTKVRNKAKGDRNLLEQEVIKLGRRNDA